MTSKNNIVGLLSLLVVISASLPFLSNVFAEPAPTNLIKNPQFAMGTASGGPDFWLKGSWGNHNASFIYPATGPNGTKAAKIRITSYAGGDAKWYFQNVPVTPDQTYTLSHSYLSTAESEIIIRYLYTNGQYEYHFVRTLPPAYAWTNTTETIVVPKNVSAMTMFHSIYSAGELTIADYNLSVKGTTPAPSPLPTLPPTVSLQTPPNPTNIQGSVTLDATANSASGITGVTLFIDGAPATIEDTVAPYQFVWDSRMVTNGIHMLEAVVRDIAGVRATSSPVVVTVYNVGGTSGGGSTTGSVPTSPAPTATQLIKNPSLETPAANGDPENWKRGVWGTNSTSFIYPVAGTDGADAARVQINSYSNGDAKWYFDKVAVTAGEKYTITHKYKSNIPSETGFLLTFADGHDEYRFDQNIPVASAWTNTTSQFTVPSGVTGLSLFHSIYQVGWVDVDAYSMTKDTAQAPSAPIAGTQPPTNTAPSPTKTIMKWGAATGWRDADIQEWESRVGQGYNHLAVFVHWGNESNFPTQYTKYAKDKGRTLIIFWEATDYNNTSTEQPRFSYDAMLRGDWDAYFRSFAAQAKAYGGPVILIPFSEMNGDWFTVSGTKNGNTPAKSAAAYRYIRGFFNGVPNVKFGWAPNSNSVPDTEANRMENYYPGDAYVDIVGVDGFNFGTPWVTFDQVFGDVLRRLSLYNKPIYIFSVGVTAGPQKAAWMTDMFETQLKKYPLIQGWSWFNENKEHDWRIWSDTASFNVFMKAVNSYK